MARVQYGAMIISLRVSIGGITFSRSFSAQTARRKPKPPNPKAPLQVAKINQFAQIVATWKTFTATVRSNWATYAASLPFVNSQGDTYYITGFQAWMRYRMAFAPTDATYSAVAPTALGFGTGQYPTLAMNGADLRITGWIFAPIANEFSLITVYRPVPPTRIGPQGLTFGRYKITTTAAVPAVLAASVTQGFRTGAVIRIYVDARSLSPDNQLTNAPRTFLDATVP